MHDRTRIWFAPVALILSTVLMMAGCEPEGASSATPNKPYTDFFTPLPDVAFYPADNPYNEAKATLGEFLFWDPVLSGGMNVTCASCHHPEFAWADGRALSIGSDGLGLGPARQGVQQTDFHSPTVLNAGFVGIDQTTISPEFVSGGYFWDLRTGTLEDQALQPILSAVEMRGDGFSEDEIFPEIVSRLSLIPEYVELFERAFAPTDAITSENIAKALATFQRGLITRSTRFDDFLAGNTDALTPVEVVGLNKFINGGCTDCHSGPMLTDVLIRDDQPVITEQPAVRTPGLRNVELTPPYMHDGSRSNLVSAIAIYEERGDLGVTLNDDDFGEIAAFLRTLTDSEFYRNIPVSVPSNLTVGGDIH